MGSFGTVNFVLWGISFLPQSFESSKNITFAKWGPRFPIARALRSVLAHRPAQNDDFKGEGGEEEEEGEEEGAEEAEGAEGAEWAEGAEGAILVVYIPLKMRLILIIMSINIPINIFKHEYDTDLNRPLISHIWNIRNWPIWISNYVKLPIIRPYMSGLYGKSKKVHN